MTFATQYLILSPATTKLLIHGKMKKKPRLSMVQSEPGRKHTQLCLTLPKYHSTLNPRADYSTARPIP